MMAEKELENAALESGRIVSVTRVPHDAETTGIPEHLRVVIKSVPGAGSLIMSELWLPAEWNGTFTGLGNGGMAGAIPHDWLAEMVRGGYAAASTDMGTSRGRESGISNPDVWKDFGYRATHLMTVQSKSLIEKYYGRAADISYFIGASTGGQQAFSLAQRYPADYDGILAGVPANNRTNLHAYFLWNHVHLRRRDGSVMFTEEEVTKITETAVRFCRGRGDGQPGDNFVSAPYKNENTIPDFLVFLKSETGFSDEQINALNAVYDGPKSADGYRIYNGMPIGSEKYSCGILDCQGGESPHFYPFIWAFGRDYDAYNFDFGGDMRRFNELLAEYLNANSPDLDSFYKNGGKMIAYSGSADPCVPYPDALNYYRRVKAEMGDRTAEFFRYYLMPGKEHGEFGDGTNALLTGKSQDAFAALRKWRECGIAPQQMYAARVDTEGNITLSRRIEPPDDAEACPPCCDEIYL